MGKLFIELFSELFCGGKIFSQYNKVKTIIDNLAAKTKQNKTKIPNKYLC